MPVNLFMGSSHQEEPRSARKLIVARAVHANLLLKIFGRARDGLAPASSAVVMGEVGCVPLGRWQHTRRVAHASDECAIEREARIVFRICNRQTDSFVTDRGTPARATAQVPTVSASTTLFRVGLPPPPFDDLSTCGGSV